jgi:hypothetical protein
MVGTLWKAVRDLDAVDDGLPVDPIWRLDYLQHGLRQRLEHLIACLRAHAREDLRGISAAERRGKGVPLRRGLRMRRPADRFRIATLYDGAVEEPAAGRGDQVEADTVTACRRARDGHVPRVPAELGDVVPNPDECSPLVEQAVVARRGIGGILRRERTVG